MEGRGQRRRRRVKISQTVRVRPSSPSDTYFEDVSLTVSASPNGLYFTTRRDSYYKGMRVFVTFPYSRSADRGDCEYIGEVLNVESLGSTPRGVAVRFLSKMNLIS